MYPIEIRLSRCWELLFLENLQHDVAFDERDLSENR